DGVEQGELVADAGVAGGGPGALRDGEEDVTAGQFGLEHTRHSRAGWATGDVWFCGEFGAWGDRQAEGQGNCGGTCFLCSRRTAFCPPAGHGGTNRNDQVGAARKWLCRNRPALGNLCRPECCSVASPVPALRSP